MTSNALETVGLGMYFEDFPVGRKFKTLRRTIQDADICAFINVIHMTEVLFTDMEFMRDESDIKGRLAPGGLVYGFAEGLLTQATLQRTGYAFIGMELEMKNPAFAGDTLHVEVEIIEARLSKTRPGRGLIRSRNRVLKQDGSEILVYTPLRMIKCRNVPTA
jgi:acyl dehydratase